MTSPAPQSTSSGPSVEDIQAAADEILATGRLILAVGRRTLPLLPNGALVLPFVHRLDQLAARLELLNDLFGRVLIALGDPDALRAAGSVWANDIGRAVGRLAGTTTADHVQSDYYWTGLAGDAYFRAMLPQQAALAQVKAIGDEIDIQLNDLANSLADLRAGLLNTILGATPVLLVAATFTATGIGAPAGIAAVLAALAWLIPAVQLAVTTFTDHGNSIATTTAAIQRRISDDTTFPGGAWPRPRPAISSDGSITDGDGTHWRLKR